MNGGETNDPVFRFSVRIADDTMETDALLFDEVREIDLHRNYVTWTALNDKNQYYHGQIKINH